MFFWGRQSTNLHQGGKDFRGLCFADKLVLQQLRRGRSLAWVFLEARGHEVLSTHEAQVLRPRRGRVAHDTAVLLTLNVEEKSP